MSDPGTLLLSSSPSPGVQWLRLNRPKQRNALNSPLLSELANALGAADQDDTIKVVVVAGNDRVFAAGADVSEMVQNDMVGMMASERPELWRRIGHFSKSLIAAVNGFALGAGNELVMNADIVIAGETAQFGQPEVGLGIIPGAGGTQRLVRTVGKPLAAGLVAEVTIPEMVNERALKLAANIAAFLEKRKPTFKGK
jgi:enoyl-CoA hydratase